MDLHSKSINFASRLSFFFFINFASCSRLWQLFCGFDRESFAVFSSFLFDLFVSEKNLHGLSVSVTRRSKPFLCVSRSVTFTFIIMTVFLNFLNTCSFCLRNSISSNSLEAHRGGGGAAWNLNAALPKGPGGDETYDGCVMLYGVLCGGKDSLIRVCKRSTKIVTIVYILFYFRTVLFTFFLRFYLSLNGERGGSVVECRTPEREVRGSRPTAAVLCPWARHFTPRKYWLITQEAMAPSRYDWKIVDWDVKPQYNQPTNQPFFVLPFHQYSHLSLWTNTHYGHLMVNSVVFFFFFFFVYFSYFQVLKFLIFSYQGLLEYHFIYSTIHFQSQNST